MIAFYGAPASSSGRTHLMLEECGVGYVYHKLDLRDPAAKAAYQTVNPSGRVPFIIDGDVRMQESIAINFYLAESYAPALWASTPAQRAKIYAWSLWAITNLQEETMRVARHTVLIPGEDRSAYEARVGKLNTQQLLDELDRTLSSGYVAGGKLSVADLNVASVVNLAAAFQAGTLGASTTAWLAELKARPAWQKVARGG